jgi:hypothetical protein
LEKNVKKALLFSIAISASFPQLKVLAVDCDAESIRQANLNIKVGSELKYSRRKWKKWRTYSK